MKRTGFSLLSLILLFSANCGKGGKEPAADEEASLAVPVQATAAQRESIENIFSGEAVLYPVDQANIAPKVSAPVKRFLVNRGDRVRKGQLLAELENGEMIQTAEESRALLEQAQAQYRTTVRGSIPEELTKAKADASAAQEELEAGKKLYANRTKLVQEGALAQKLADDAKVALVQAQSRFETAERHLDSLQQVSRAEQTKAAQGQLDAAKAHYAAAEIQAGYAEIRSPIDGVVADRPSFAGEMATAGAPLINVIDASRIVARVNVPAAEASRMKLGDPASIAGSDGPVEGAVIVVSPSVDPSTTTVEVWVRAPNQKGVLKVGSTAAVSIVQSVIPDAIVVPRSALLSSESGNTVVMVVTSGSIAHQREVEVGARQAGRVQIIEGVRAGEEVVTEGGVGLPDGAKVKIGAATEHD